MYNKYFNVILQTSPGGISYKCGAKTKDKIISINDKLTTDMSIAEAQDMVRIATRFKAVVKRFNYLGNIGIYSIVLLYSIL